MLYFRRIAAGLMAAAVVACPATSAHAVAEPSPDEAALVRAAHQVNLSEIASGQVAWRKTTDPAVKKVAALLLRNHIHLDADLYTVARKLRIFLPDEPTAEQQALTRRYEAAGADTFDEHYLSSRLDVQRQYRRTVSTLMEESTTLEVRQLAERAIPVIAEHQELLQKAAEAEGVAVHSTGGGHSSR